MNVATRFLTKYPITFIITLITILISSQRIILSPIDTLCCIIPFIFALNYFHSDRKKFNTLLLISIFISVDNGAEVFNTTPSIIRYVLYCVGIYTLLYKNTLSKKKLVLFGICFIPILTLTAFNTAGLVIPVLQRDIFLIVLSIIALCMHQKSLEKFEFDFNFFSQALVVYMLGELINIFFFFSFSTHGYLNYSTTKSLIVFPFLYILHQKKSLPKLLFYFALTFIVAIFYVTRLILLGLVLVLILYMLKKLLKLKPIYLFYIVCALVIGSNIQISEKILGDYKLGKTFLKMSEKLTISEAIQAMDPVRYAEFQIFIDRPWYNIIFGSGLGSSIRDTKGYLDFVKISDTAFSENEINSNVFYNFHDIWTDFGLRIGIITLIGLGLVLYLDIGRTPPLLSTLSMTLIVMLLCQFFSSAGLINIAFFTLFYRKIKETEHGTSY